MKLLFLVLVCVVLCDENYDRTNSLIDWVNSLQKDWVAEHNKFSSLTLKEKKSMCQVDLTQTVPFKKPVATSYVGVPDTFDSREAWPDCKTISNIRDQGSEVLSDKFCIYSSGSVNLQLSPQDLVSCDYGDMGCDGGQLGTEWDYMKSHGIVPDTCMPYESGNGSVPSCPAYCKDDPTKRVNDEKYKAKSYSHVGWYIIERVKEIEKEISEHGSVEMAFTVYEDFMQYKSGVYHHTSGQMLGGHAVKGIGYGKTENGDDYWIIANSWNTNWGMDGYFWMRKGRNECGIEANVYTAVPAV